MNKAKYVRLYTDEDGKSHFEDLEIGLEPADFAPPAEPLNVAQFYPTAQSMWVGAPPRWAGEEPHLTPQRQIFCTLQGEYAVTASDGSERRFPVGSVLVLEDTWGKGHSTRILSQDGGLVIGVALA